MSVMQKYKMVPKMRSDAAARLKQQRQRTLILASRPLSSLPWARVVTVQLAISSSAKIPVGSQSLATPRREVHRSV